MRVFSHLFYLVHNQSQTNNDEIRLSLAKQKLYVSALVSIFISRLCPILVLFLLIAMATHSNSTFTFFLLRSHVME